MCKSLKKIPYNDTTNTNKIPRKIFVLIKANKSNPFESLRANTWVVTAIIAIKITSISREKIPNTDITIKNHKENPAVTVNALNLGEDNSIISDKLM